MSDLIEIREDMKQEVAAKQPAPENAAALPKKKKWVVPVVLIAVSIILISAGFAYFAIADYYKTHFLPGTTINQMACDNLESGRVSALLESQSLTYQLSVTGRDKQQIGTLSAEDIGLRIVDTLQDVERLLDQQNPMAWPLAFWGGASQSHEILCTTEFSSDQVLEAIREWPALNTTRMRSPIDAYISSYLPDKKGYEIVPEQKGTTLDLKMVEELVLLSVEGRETQLHLEEEGCYLEPEVTGEDKALNERVNALNKLTGARITYDWNGTQVVLDGDTIKEWITGIYAGEVLVDQKKVAEYVNAQAKKYDTYGKHRTFTTTLGETVKVLNGGYGWKTDKDKESAELFALINEGAVVEREPIYRVTAKKKGTDDIGDSYVEIDLTNQHLYLYWKGELVLETDFVSGDIAQGNVTPGGLFRLTYKTRNAVLRGANYATPVSYWMPFNGNIGMHDATWRNAFGGDIYLTDGSHGCINLPLDKAKDIYAYVSTGFPIICYYY